MENLLDNNEIEAAIEGILFTAAEPVAVSKIAEALDMPIEELLKHIENLFSYYKNSKRGMEIISLSGKLQMCSNKRYAEYIRAALDKRKTHTLSKASLEVLAIIAYRQPVTRVYIEHIRGVECSNIIASLEEKELIEEGGRLDVPGRPILYRTTDKFLRSFGLSEISELPDIDKAKECKAELPVRDGD